MGTRWSWGYWPQSNPELIAEGMEELGVRECEKDCGKKPFGGLDLTLTDEWLRKGRGVYVKYAAEVFSEAFLSAAFAETLCLSAEKTAGVCVGVGGWVDVFIWVCCVRDLTCQLVNKGEKAAECCWGKRGLQNTHTHFSEPENIWANNTKCGQFCFNLVASCCTVTRWIFHSWTAFPSIKLTYRVTYCKLALEEKGVCEVKWNKKQL